MEITEQPERDGAGPELVEQSAPGGVVAFARHSARELTVAVLLVLAFVVGARLSPNFLDLRYLLDTTSLYMETGILALGMTLLIISGNIDLSVASSIALVAAVTGVCAERLGTPFVAALALGLLLGGLLGLFNGFLIARMHLPSLTVTLGTFALYRGIAQILIGDRSISRLPEWFNGIDYLRVGGLLPLPLLIFLGLSLFFALLLHRTVLGRWTYAIGVNKAASRYSGVPVARVTILLYVVMGLLAGLSGLIMMSRLGVARYDMAQGLELDVITAVVLGGTDIFGGRGTIAGTVMALFLIGVLRRGMGLANVKAENQLIVIGLLLIASIVLPNLLRRRKNAW